MATDKSPAPPYSLWRFELIACSTGFVACPCLCCCPCCWQCYCRCCWLCCQWPHILRWTLLSLMFECMIQGCCSRLLLLYISSAFFTCMFERMAGVCQKASAFFNSLSLLRCFGCWMLLLLLRHTKCRSIFVYSLFCCELLLHTKGVLVPLVMLLLQLPPVSNQCFCRWYWLLL